MRTMTIPTSPAACIPQLDNMNRLETLLIPHKEGEEETSEIVKLELRKHLNIAKLGLHAGENATEKGGQKKQLNSVKLGFADKEKLTEEGGHRHGAKKQLNSMKLGLSYGDNRTERAGHNSVEKLLSCVLFCPIEAIVFQQKTVHF